MTIELRNSDKLPRPAGYSHASIAPAGRIVHLAGQIGIDADGTHPDGLAAQTEQAFINLVDALTGASDATVTDLVKITAGGLRESHPHDVVITREAPNYRL